VAHQVKLFNATFKNVKLEIRNFEHITYATEMGFFDCLGASIGRSAELIGGDINYLPVTVMNTREFLNKNVYENVHAAVDAERPASLEF